MEVIKKIETGIRPFARIAAIFSVIAGVGIAYWFYLDNIWRPKVSLISVDYETGVAVLNVNGKEKTLYDGSTISAMGHWGIRFAGGDGRSAERLELIKNEITYQVIDISKIKPTV